LLPEDQPFVVPALQLLKGNEDDMEWRIDISSDTMAVIDYTQQKAERTEFLNAVATFLQSAATVGQNSPDLIPMMATLLKFGVAGFRVGKEVEGVIDSSIAKIEQQLEAQKAAPPPPDPAMLKAQADIQAKQADAQLKREQTQADFQMKQMEFMQDMRQAQMKFDMELKQMAQEFNMKLIQLQEESKVKREVAMMNGAAQAEATLNKPENNDGA
jgi:hypothetical protein